MASTMAKMSLTMRTPAVMSSARPAPKARKNRETTRRAFQEEKSAGESAKTSATTTAFKPIREAEVNLQRCDQTGRRMP